MTMTNKDYRDFAEKKSPNSPIGTDVLRAFLVGGLICAIGQGIIGAYLAAGLTKDAAGTAASITLVLIGAALTGLGVYDRIAKFAGAGTLVPITGFANSVVAPALEFKTEGFITGTAAKMFVVAGPVIVFGITASVVYGLILCLIK
mgnify:CR=1 FL=1